MDRKQHWEKVYQFRTLEEFSWYQPKPDIAIHFLKLFQVSRSARIIDIGGGDTLLVDYLLEQGFERVSVLDISETAIERAHQRLGAKANQVEWIVSDVVDFQPDRTYDFWHDRAAFHFLTDVSEVNQYLANANRSISSAGAMVIGTFSESGPTKCSGIEIEQYSEQTMTALMVENFAKVKCFETTHVTPSNVNQNFMFCGFRKRH